MVLNGKPTGRSTSIPKGLIFSAIVALFLTISGSAIIACLIKYEVLAEHHIGYAVMFMLIVAAFGSSYIAWKQIKRRKLLVCALAGGIYYVVLLSITGLFFGGQYTALAETALLVFCGSMLGVMAKLSPSRGRKYRARKSVYR